MKKLAAILISSILFLAYAVIGTSGNVDEIKQKAPSAMLERGWEILRYEGYQFGSFSMHGGKVWYHVKDLNVPDTYYRVFITIWGGELQFYYSEPERLGRININYGE